MTTQVRGRLLFQMDRFSGSDARLLEMGEDKMPDELQHLKAG